MRKIGKLTYFGDPMCSWCWGFRPVLEQITGEYPELQRIVVMGGLRGGEEKPMDDALARMIQNGWHRIEKNTGQPFNHQLWKNHRPLATTWPACRAVLSARLLDGELEWPFMVAMFKAYFTQGRDPSRVETHMAVADHLGINPAVYQGMLESAAPEKALQQDLLVVRRFGVTGFPTVVLSIGNSNYLVSPGYQPVEGMRKAINAAYEDAGVEFIRPENGLYN